jgi:septal ring factor EnvC (AmiA/AmiB activator)
VAGVRGAAAALLAAPVLLALLLAAPARADRRADLEALRAAVQDARERVATYESEQRGLLEALEALDRSAELLARDVTRARRSAREARSELARVEAEGAELVGRLEATKRSMRERARALYRAGELGAVRLLFSAGDLSEFFSRISTLRRLLSHDAELLARHRAQSLALAEAEARARSSAAELARAEQILAERRADLDSERERKRVLVRRLHHDRARERAALRELETAARALEETLATLGAEPEVARAAPSGPAFESLRRRLAPPVDGPVALAFGRVVDPRFRTETFHPGQVYEVPLGTPVRAVAAGVVRFAGWFQGYGRMVILDHGDGYFTVSGHLDRVDVERGDGVAAGEVFGSVGETGSLSGPRLYFEIRRGGEPLDPAEWLLGRAAG